VVTLLKVVAPMVVRRTRGDKRKWEWRS